MHRSAASSYVELEQVDCKRLGKERYYYVRITQADGRRDGLGQPDLGCG